MLDSVTNTVASNAGPIKTPTHRKINKLMMEKRRRTRINNCLSELKTLVLKALKKDGEQFSKLEKVDILEMTVKYLRFLHQQQQVNITTDSLGGKYRVPLDVEVMRYMNSEEARNRLTDHISKCVRVSSGSPTHQPIVAPTNTQSPPTPTSAHQQITTHQHQQITTPQTPEHIRHSQQPQMSPLRDNTTHIVLPIASKQSESSLMMAAVPESPYKTLTVSYTPINSSPNSSSPSTHVINTPVNSLSAITSNPNTITSPSIVHMKALVSDSNATNGCYVSTVPVYVGSISEAKPTSATLAGFYTQPFKRNCSPEPIKELPLWRPW